MRDWFVCACVRMMEDFFPCVPKPAFFMHGKNSSILLLPFLPDTHSFFFACASERACMTARVGQTSPLRHTYASAKLATCSPLPAQQQPVLAAAAAACPSSGGSRSPAQPRGKPTISEKKKKIVSKGPTGQSKQSLLARESHDPFSSKASRRKKERERKREWGSELH